METLLGMQVEQYVWTLTTTSGRPWMNTRRVHEEDSSPEARPDPDPTRTQTSPQPSRLSNPSGSEAADVLSIVSR